MPILIVIAILFVMVYYLVSSDKKNESSAKQQQTFKSNPTYSPNTIRDTPKPKQKEIIVKTLDLPDDEEDGIYIFNIAGITYHCNLSDQGIFNGIIYNESTNKYNPEAMAIVSMNKKLLGYVSEDELDDYLIWCDEKPVTCVGYISTFINDYGKKTLYGKVFAIKPCNSEFVKKTTQNIINEIKESENLTFSKV